MQKAKRILVVLVIVLAMVLVGVTAAALVSRHHYLNNHVFMGDTPYPKDAQVLDLRGTGISPEYYLELQGKLPNCRIQWEVPFQGGYLDPDSRELTVSSLSREDADLLAFFPNLTTLDARQCRDYEQLIAFQQSRPECRVLYNVTLGGKDYPQDTRELTLEGCSDADIAQLGYLTQLQSAVIANPTAAPDALQSLIQAMPQVSFTVEKEILGITVTSADTELDLSGVSISGTQELEGLDYFPALEKVFLGECGVDNETLAAYRETKREQYKLVWTVQCGKLTARTDDLYFMPVKYHVYYFHDEDAYNLRYCEDMVCVDLGHMSIHDLDFVRHMPNLKYLILAHTTVLDITPLSECKNLLFLELDWTGVRDYSPLLGCTSLEDLNLGNTYGDITPITKMTWLKNLWWVGRNYAFKESMADQLPNTNKMFDGKFTVSNGWRQLPNYYDMRDILGMEYM